MVGYRSARFYVFITLGLFISAFLLYIPRTDIPSRSKQYVSDLLASTRLTNGKQEEEYHGADMESFNFDKYFYQADLDWYEPVVFNVAKLKEYSPVHYQGPGHPTFATFYASRNSSMKDPYFYAAQQIVYRLLWDPRSRTTQYPVTVFVAPFISQEQRDYFAAAGAVVRELPLRLYHPEHDGVPGRLADMFSKLEMWSQTDYSLISYVDSDAFPIENIDAIFSLATAQQCKEDFLSDEEKAVSSDICPYTFAAYNEFGDKINAGVMVFSPNENMHKRLVRSSLNHSDFDTGFMEQDLLNYAYDLDGPFPASHLDHSFNAGPERWISHEEMHIVHAKLWALIGEFDNVWYKHTFNYTWLDMKDLYESDDFEQLRASGSTPTESWYCCRDLKPEFVHNEPAPTGVWS